MKRVIQSAVFTATFLSALAASANCVVSADRYQQRQQQQDQHYLVPNFPDVIREENADLDQCISTLSLLHHEVANSDEHCYYRSVTMTFDYYGVALTATKPVQQCQQQQQRQLYQQQQMPPMDRTIQNTDKQQ